MNKRLSFLTLALLVIGSIVLSACAPAATEAPVSTEAPATEAPATEPAAPAVGSADHPIKVLFVPSVDANIIVTGGDVMASALHDATGLEFEVTVPTSYAATIEEICASPTD